MVLFEVASLAIERGDMKKSTYDLVILGGGAAGLTAAKSARGFGKKVLIIEQAKLGGECTWTGCVPSKALINVARKLNEAKNIHSYGIRIKNKIEYETDYMMDYGRSIINNVY